MRTVWKPCTPQGCSPAKNILFSFPVTTMRCAHHKFTCTGHSRDRRTFTACLRVSQPDLGYNLSSLQTRKTYADRWGVVVQTTYDEATKLCDHVRAMPPLIFYTCYRQKYMIVVPLLLSHSTQTFRRLPHG